MHIRDNMNHFDRWRPGTGSSREEMLADEQDRVDEEKLRLQALEDRVRLAGDEVAIAKVEGAMRSRELSFIPARRQELAKDRVDPTAALIARYKQMARLPHGETLVTRLEDWKWLDAMQGPADKQRFLEPLIAAIQRDPVQHEDKLIFLLIVCEPIRRSVSKDFMAVRAGLAPSVSDVNWANRSEAKHIAHIEREQLWDVTRIGLLEALYRYPQSGPRKFFPWLRNAIAHRALDHLSAELPELASITHKPAETEAIQKALHGFKEAAEPDMKSGGGLWKWRRHFDMRSVFTIVDQYFDEAAVRDTCQAAVGRLPRVQCEVITELYFEHHNARDLAAHRQCARSTVDNNHAKAKRNLHDDDCFYMALHALGKVRGNARAAEIRRRYPDGVMPDGRRIVPIAA